MTKPMSAKQKKRRRRAIRRRRILLLLLIIAAMISVCLFTPFFNVKTVELQGNEILTAEQVLSAAAVPEGINIFKVRKRAVKKSILQIPEVEKIEVHRRLPGKILLEITETHAALVFPYLSGYAATNENGRVMALLDGIDGQSLLYITGLEIKNAEICEKISVQDEVKFDIIVDTIQKLRDTGLLSEIKSCHFDNLSDFNLYLTDGTKVIFGKTTEMDYKISVLANILPRVNRTEGAYIDLTTPSHAIYGILEPEPAPAAAPEPEDTDTPAEESPAAESPSAEPTAEAAEPKPTETGQ